MLVTSNIAIPPAIHTSAQFINFSCTSLNYIIHPTKGGSYTPQLYVCFTEKLRDDP